MSSLRRSTFPVGKSRCRQARTYFLQVRRTHMSIRQSGRLARLPACIREWRPSIGKGLTLPSIPLCPSRAVWYSWENPCCTLSRKNGRDGLRTQSAKIVVRAVRCAWTAFSRLDGYSGQSRTDSKTHRISHARQDQYSTKEYAYNLLNFINIFEYLFVFLYGGNDGSALL